MKIAISVEHFACGYVGIDFNSEYVTTLLSRVQRFRELAEQDPSLSEIVHYDDHPVYGIDIHGDDVDEADPKPLPEDGCEAYIIVDEMPEEDEDLRVGLCEIHIDKTAFWYTALPKHSDERIETQPIQIKFLEYLAKQPASD